MIKISMGYPTVEEMSGCHTEYIRGKGNDVCHYLE